MRIKKLLLDSFGLTPSDGNYERIARLCEIYDMNYEDVLSYMFSFTIYMADTRILNRIDKD